MKEDKLIKQVKTSIANAYLHKSKLNDTNIIEREGMSGKQQRHFINNLCELEDLSYLEVGLFTGIMFCSALYKNSGKFLGIDNWTEFNHKGDIRDLFFLNLKTFKTNQNIKIIENDCWLTNLSASEKINVFNYDGEHSAESHASALAHFYSALDEVFIFIVDDWNWSHIRTATYDSFNKLCLSQIYEHEIYTSYNNQHPSFENARQRGNWHNGMACFVLKKA